MQRGKNGGIGSQHTLHIVWNTRHWTDSREFAFVIIIDNH